MNATKRRRVREAAAGQATIEAVLIMTVLLSIVIAVSQQFKSRQILQQLTVGPWNYVRGMIQYGIWDPAPRNLKHPNMKNRHASNEPEKT